MICKNCGNEIDINSLYCKYCGSKQTSPSIFDLLEFEWVLRIFNWLYSDENRKKSLIVIGILAFLVSLLIVIFPKGYIPFYAFFILLPVWYFQLGVVLPIILGLLLDLFSIGYLLIKDLGKK